jgi:two-component system, OmpR family, sensor kinase
VSRLPIRVRLTLAFALVMAVILALLGVFLHVRLQSSLDERIADSLESRSAALVNAVREGDPIAGIDPALLRPEDGLVDVVKPNGRGTLPSGDPVLTTDQLAAARRGSITFESGGFRVRADPVGGSVVVVGESLEDRDEALDALLAELLIALPLALLVSSVVGYLVAGAALRPVETMRRRAAEISADTPERRLPLPRASDEIRRLGETLNEMLARLEAAFERERRFVADASHELRTPLTTLRAELELALRGERDAAELRAAVASAHEEARRMSTLADDLLVLARADQGRLPVRPEPWAAQDLIASAAHRAEAALAQAGRSIAAVDGGDGAAVVLADPDRVA